MKIFLYVSLLVFSLFSSEIKPFKSYVSSGAVVDLVYADGLLYASTNTGVIDIFDVKSKKTVKQIKVEKIKDFMGDLVDSKIYSVDVIDDKILILSQTKQGFRRVHIHENNINTLVIDASDSLAIAKAKFLDSNTIILALLSNEIISLDIKTKKQNWKIQVSGAKFSNFVLNETKDTVVVADESGDLKLYKTSSGTFIKKLSGQNLDNVFQVDMKNGVIATAGQDRRVVVYRDSSAYYKSASFLIYSVGISPSGNSIGYASDENNNVTVFDTKTKKTLGIFGGNKMTLTNILFINEDEFFVSSDDSLIHLYKMK